MRAAMRLRLTLVLAAIASGGCTVAVAAKPAATSSSTATAVAMAPSLTEGMRRVTAELAALGLRPDARAFGGFLPSGNHATFPLHVDGGTCATMVAFATRNANDVDAALYTPDGELVALDSEPDPHPTLQVCTAEAARDFYYVIQLYDGDGSFAVRAFYGPRTTLGAAARVVGGRPSLADLSRPREHASDPLADLREGMRKRGFVSTSEPVVFAIAERERVRTAMQVESATCYTVAAFGQAGVRKLALRVLDAQGVFVGTSDGSDARAALQLCARERARYTVETESHEGAGQVTLATFQADVVVAGGDAGLWLGQRNAAKQSDEGAR